MLIFVTEPFSAQKQVKLDRPDDAGADHVPVLKLNPVRKFTTGIYPYSMMQSVFSPLAGGQPLKLTTSSQEWCGHTFLQLNREKDGRYAAQSHSYFESEGDVQRSLPKTILEDQLWNQIRIDPAGLPLGDAMVLPSTTFLRLSHLPLKPVMAPMALAQQGPGLQVYTVRYHDIERLVTIRFESAFPYRIQGWQERYQSGWGADAKVLTTKATLNKRIMLDYWNKHGTLDAPLRSRLGL